MLKAVLEGKSRRVAIEEFGGTSWRELFSKSEDLLTAVFFGRIRYLSSGGENNVLGLLVGSELAASLGEIEDILYWPKLKGLNGRSHVEPDILILFENDLLVIEVKPPFGGIQNLAQWHAQIESIICQKKQEDSPIEVPDRIHFLALGRPMNDSQSSVDNVLQRYSREGLKTVLVREWQSICNGIHHLFMDDVSHDKNVFQDWINAFDLFGMVEVPLPFEDLMKLNNSINRNWMMLLDAEAKQDDLPNLVEWDALHSFAGKINLKGVNLL